MTINNKSERNYRGKCLGWPVTSYGGDNFFFRLRPPFVSSSVSNVTSIGNMVIGVRAPLDLGGR